MPRRCLLPALILVLLMAAHGQGYFVRQALLLEQLARECDLVVKVQALGTEPVQDAAFADLSGSGYAVFATRLKVISVLKGDAKLAEATFHHYDKRPDQQGEPPVSPQIYHFTAEKPYILFAKKSAEPLIFRTFTVNHTSQPDQGLVRAANADPLPPGMTVKGAVWHELTALAASKEPADVVYAIDLLDVLTNPRWYDRAAKADFPRQDALDVIRPFLAGEDSAVVTAALQAVGRSSPYWSDGIAQGWLATVGKGKALRRGYGTYPDNYSNPSALRCRSQLVALANASRAAEIRALAIRALGRSRENEEDNALLEPLRHWTTDPEALVRAAAAVLWSDYPSKEASAALESLAGDKAPVVRTAAAYAIGFSQRSDLLSILDRMLADPEEIPGRAAAVSVLSFDPLVAAPILKSHLKDSRYSVAFTNALAEADPAAYRDDLVAILKAKPGPETTFTGQVPTYTAWDILMTHVTTLDPAALRAGKLDRYLDALESPPDIGSSPYQTLYQFCHDQGLTARSQSFRKKANAHVTGYDLDYYFKQIDGGK